MEEQRKKHVEERKEHSFKTNGTTITAQKSAYELSPVEAENIHLFSALVDRFATPALLGQSFESRKSKSYTTVLES